MSISQMVFDQKMLNRLFYNLNLNAGYFNSEVVHNFLVFYIVSSKVLTYLGFSVMFGLILKGGVKGFMQHFVSLINWMTSPFLTLSVGKMSVSQMVFEQKM